MNDDDNDIEGALRYLDTAMACFVGACLVLIMLILGCWVWEMFQ